jgi:hypothetical protein
MNVTRRSPFSGKLHTMDIPNLTPELLKKIEDPNRGLIQNVAPNLTPDEREFLMTGITPQEWEDTFGGKDE